MISRIFFVIAAILFFLDAAGAVFIPRQLAWGLCSTAIGLAVWGYPLYRTGPVA